MSARGGLPAARFAVEQRVAYFFLERGVEHLKRLGTEGEKLKTS